MKILYILKHNPWGIGGGCYASKSYLYAFLRVFDTSQFTILLCSEYKKDIPQEILNDTNIEFIYTSPLGKVDALIEFLHRTNHRHRKVAKCILRQKTFDYCVFDHSSLAGSMVDYLPKSTKSIVIHHNCECSYFKDNNSGVYSMLLLPIVRYNERQAFEKCDYNIFLTKEDFDTFKNIYGNKNDGYVIGGFEYGDITEPSFDYRQDKLVITGSLANIQNQDGILTYLESLHQYIPDGYKVTMAGQNPSEEIRSKVKEFSNIILIPSPPDMNPIVSGARGYICPTRLGSGIKIRIKDALRKGIPVLAHEVSARGYSDFVEAGLMFKYSDEHEFVEGLNSLLLLEKADREKIFRMFQERFSFDYGCKRIREMLGI